MVKFITKTVCIALIGMLCVGSVNAQFEKVKGTPKEKIFAAASITKPVAPTPTSRGTITDDVEGHVAFTIDSPGDVPWSYYNGNGGGTWGIQGVEFPGSYEPMAYIVFNPSGTTPPLTTNYPPHSGSQFFACFNPESGAANAWIISPSFTVESNATISFWAREMVTTYGPELMKVSTSSTGNAPANFTNVISPGTVQVNTTNWTQYTYNIPNDAKYVAITCVSNDVFALFIDDITIDGIAYSGPVPCDPISNLQTEIQGTDVKLTWTAAPGNPTGYKIYDGTTNIGTTTNTTFVAAKLSSGTHTLGVEATYDDGCIPERVTVTVNVPVALNPIKNLNGGCIDGELSLTWDAPNAKSMSRGVTLQYSDEPGDGIGTDAPHNITPASRWTPSDLAALGIVSGMMLEKVSFVPYQPNNATYTIKVWQGGSWGPNNPGTELISQALTSSSLVAEAWNEITLTAPVEIDATKELWIGYNTNATAGHPSGVDLGPIAAPNKSNICLMGSWTTLVALNPDLTCNWCIRGIVAGDPVLPEVVLYQVYQDDVKYGEVAAPTTTFTKAGVSGKHNYCIVAVYENDAQSDKVCKEITCGECNPPTDLTILIQEGSSCTALLKWTAAENTPNATYNVYRDGVLINDNPITATQYVDREGIEKDVEYEWEVKTVCQLIIGTEGAKIKGTCGDPDGINELSNVSIYPNPSNSTVTIVVNGFAKVEIYNTVGQLVETRTNDTVDVSNYNTGVYFFKVYDVDNNSVTKRIMVTK